MIKTSILRLLSVALVLTFSTLLFAQEDKMAEAKKRQAEMMQTQMFMSQLMQLGFNDELRKDLEIVDDQVKTVKKLAQDYQKEMMEFHMQNRDLGLEIQELYQAGKHEEARQLSEEFQQKNQGFSQGYMDKAKEILLPHQIERLQQIARQQRAKNSNQFGDEFGTAISLADEIGLSAEEKKRLVDAVKAARKEYYETVNAAKTKAKEKIMSSLTTDQQAKLNELLGDEFNQEDSIRKMREEAMKKQREMMKRRQQKRDES